MVTRSIINNPIEFTTIRKAEERDYDWVNAQLQILSLAKEYAYQTPCPAGQQQAFVTEEGERLTGFIRITEEEPGIFTLSSPLISRPNIVDISVASLLVTTAEDYARREGAQELRAAAKNNGMLTLLEDKNFHIAGVSNRHQDRSTGEYLLYKHLINTYDSDVSKISVASYESEKHKDRVDNFAASQQSRALNSVGMPPRDDEALLVAESNGEVIGLLGLTPTSPDKSKVTLLVAETRRVLEALLLNVKEMPQTSGRKLFIRFNPEAWQIYCLQRHGWIIEAVFPAREKHSQTVQQWSASINHTT